MSETEAMQEEEREVLLSIYEGDQCFKQVTPNSFQYKYGTSDTIKSFLLEIKWGPNYPDDLPDVNLDLFYNKHINSALKQKIQDLVKSEAEQYRGMSMTYSLFEFIKEKFEEVIEYQAEKLIENDVEKLCISEESEPMQTGVKKEKKEQLTKAQKRKQWNRADGKGEKPRGWNWMDIVKHLSQTGSKEDSNPIT